MKSSGLVVESVRASCAGSRKRITVSTPAGGAKRVVSSRPARSDAAAHGCLRSSCRARLSSCRARLSSCRARLSSCRARLSSCRARLSSMRFERTGSSLWYAAERVRPAFCRIAPARASSLPSATRLVTRGSAVGPCRRLSTTQRGGSSPGRSNCASRG